MALGIIVHGGAKTISEDKVAANNAGCLAAVEERQSGRDSQQ